MKKIFSIFFFTSFGILLFFQNSEPLIEKLLEIRQNYIIKKSDFETTFIFSKENYLTIKNAKEIIVADKYYDIKKVIQLHSKVKLIVIEDKNESLFKFISYSLKKENSKKNKAKFKRNIILALLSPQEIETRHTLIDRVLKPFYKEQNNPNKIVSLLLKPPIILTKNQV